jgi:hypothetical protein
MHPEKRNDNRQGLNLKLVTQTKYWTVGVLDITAINTANNFSIRSWDCCFFHFSYMPNYIILNWMLSSKNDVGYKFLGLRTELMVNIMTIDKDKYSRQVTFTP